MVFAFHEFADVAVIAMERAMSVPARTPPPARVQGVMSGPPRIHRAVWDAGPGWPTLAEQVEPPSHPVNRS